MAKIEAILKRFEEPDEVHTFEKGKFEVVHIGGMTIGRATYEPGWKWSLHVGTAMGAEEAHHWIRINPMRAGAETVLNMLDQALKEVQSDVS